MTSTTRIARSFAAVIAGAALLVAAEAGCGTGTATAVPAAELLPGRLPAYRIGPGDVIEVAVWKNPAVSRTVPVRPDGILTLPLVNDVAVAGLTPMQLRDILTLELSRFIPNVEVSVIVREVHSPKVSVFGKVGNPGRYDLVGPMRLLDLLANAGGLDDFASGDAVILRQAQDGSTQRIDIAVAAATSTYAHNPYLAPGDVVYVP